MAQFREYSIFMFFEKLSVECLTYNLHLK